MKAFHPIPAQEIIHSDLFIDFYASANMFCSLIESCEEGKEEDFIGLTQSHLLLLYDLGRQLPWVDLHINEDSASVFDFDYLKTFHSAGESLEEVFYWHVFDPTDMNETDPVCSDLRDDITDIYKDLKEAILLYETGADAAVEQAIWKFKFGFEHHWGDHCINALYALHFYQRKKTEAG